MKQPFLPKKFWSAGCSAQRNAMPDNSFKPTPLRGGLVQALAPQGRNMELLVTLLVGTAWPAASVCIALLFRREVRSVLRRVSQLKYGELEANFGEELAKAEAKAAVIAPSAPAGHQKTEIASRLRQLRRIAEASPRAAILEAWVLVEEAAAKSGYIQGAVIPRANPHLFIDDLVQQGKLPAASSVLLDQLRKLRNQAAHLRDFTITESEADRYLELAARVSELILNAE